MSTTALTFSIIIPGYNRKVWLQQAIESVLSQTYSRFELIIVNDGSTDGTEVMLEQFKNHVTVISGTHQGAETARNLGIKAATGDYIVFLDSDDLLQSNALALYTTIINQTAASLIIAKGTSFTSELSTPPPDRSSATYSLSADYYSKRCSVWLSTSFIVIQREHLVKNHIFFKPKTFPVDDLDFLLRAGTLPGCCIVHSPVTVLYRQHGTNSVLDIKRNLTVLKTVLALNKENEYPGGKKRSFDRKCLIGGHIQSWARKGLQSGFYRHALELICLGLPSILAIVIKKVFIRK